MVSRVLSKIVAFASILSLMLTPNASPRVYPIPPPPLYYPFRCGDYDGGLLLAALFPMEKLYSE